MPSAIWALLRRQSKSGSATGAITACFQVGAMIAAYSTGPILEHFSLTQYFWFLAAPGIVWAKSAGYRDEGKMGSGDLRICFAVFHRRSMLDFYQSLQASIPDQSRGDTVVACSRVSLRRTCGIHQFINRLPDVSSTALAAGAWRNSP